MLKKAVVVAGVACTIATGVTAQSTPWQAGLTGGVALTNISGDDFEGGDSKMSPYFGLSLVFQPESPFGFETGAIYIVKGTKESEDDAELKVNLKYIEVPLLARYALTLSGSAIRPIVMLGGAVGFNTGCEVEIEGGGASLSAECEEGNGLEIKSIDLGLAARAAVDIPTGERFVVSPSFRYTHGLINVIDVDDADGKNTAFVLGLSVRIRL